MRKIILGLVLLMACFNLYADENDTNVKYCWKENGVAKYSHLPRPNSTPEQREIHKVNCKRRGLAPKFSTESVETRSSSPSPTIANLPPPSNPSIYNDPEQKELDAKYKQRENELKQQNAGACKNMREQLAQLRNVSRLTVTEPNGEIRRVSDEERQAKIAEAEQNIAKNCL